MRARQVVRRSRVRSSGPAQIWQEINFVEIEHALPSAESGWAVLSYWRKNVHWVLVNRLVSISLRRKSVVNWPSRHDHSCWPWTLSNNTTTCILLDTTRLTIKKFARPFPFPPIREGQLPVDDETVCELSTNCPGTVIVCKQTYSTWP